MTIEWLDDVSNPKIAKMIKDYLKITEIIKEQAVAEWISFMSYWYFRSNDSISKTDATSFVMNSWLEKYDILIIDNFLSDWLKEDEE